MIFFSVADNSRHNKPYGNMSCLSFIDSVQHNFYSCQIKRTVNNKNHHPARNRRFLLGTREPCYVKAQYGPTIFCSCFSEQNPLNPAGISDFPARYVNIYYRQTFLLNFKIVIHQASKFLLLLFSLVFAFVPFQFEQYSFRELVNLRALYHQFLQ